MEKISSIRNVVRSVIMDHKPNEDIEELWSNRYQ
jgi:hypothetical protein